MVHGIYFIFNVNGNHKFLNKNFILSKNYIFNLNLKLRNIFHFLT